MQVKHEEFLAKHGALVLAEKMEKRKNGPQRVELEQCQRRRREPKGKSGRGVRERQLDKSHRDRILRYAVVHGKISHRRSG